MFVTDGACFVTSGSQNPTLAIMAITARACAYAVDEFRRGHSGERRCCTTSFSCDRTQPVNEPLGVGIIGTGAATQAIHVPVLARLRDRLRVTHIVGTDKRHVAAVAARAGARGGTSVEELLKDPAVDLVAVCGPNHLHAAQAAAACAAGKRGVLVEKPMALSRDEAAMVAGASARHGVPLVVGAMHSWDQAWRAASQAWLEAGGETRLIRSAIHLPVNDVILEQATDPTGCLGGGCPTASSPSWGPPSAFFGRPTSPRERRASRADHPRLRSACHPADPRHRSRPRDRRVRATHVPPLGVRRSRTTRTRRQSP